MKKLNILLSHHRIGLRTGNGRQRGAGVKLYQSECGNGNQPSGLYTEGKWLKKPTAAPRPVAWAQATNFEVGPVMLNAGAKGPLRWPEEGDNGVAFPVGGGVNVALTDSIHQVFGEGYVAPEGLNNSVKNYVEANGGVKLDPSHAGYAESGLPPRER